MVISTTSQKNRIKFKITKANLIASTKNQNPFLRLTLRTILINPEIESTNLQKNSEKTFWRFLQTWTTPKNFFYFKSIIPTTENFIKMKIFQSEALSENQPILFKSIICDPYYSFRFNSTNKLIMHNCSTYHKSLMDSVKVQCTIGTTLRYFMHIFHAHKPNDIHKPGGAIIIFRYGITSRNWGIPDPFDQSSQSIHKRR